MKQDCPAAKSYRYTLTVQTPGGTAGDDGHVDLTSDANWDTAGTIKGNFLTRGGRESRIFDQVQGEVTGIIETPSNNFTRSIHPESRLVFETRKLNVQAVIDVDERRQIVHIHYTEVV